MSTNDGKKKKEKLVRVASRLSNEANQSLRMAEIFFKNALLAESYGQNATAENLLSLAISEENSANAKFFAAEVHCAVLCGKLTEED